MAPQHEVAQQHLQHHASNCMLVTEFASDPRYSLLRFFSSATETAQEHACHSECHNENCKLPLHSLRNPDPNMHGRRVCPELSPYTGMLAFKLLRKLMYVWVCGSGFPRLAFRSLVDKVPQVKTFVCSQLIVICLYNIARGVQIQTGPPEHITHTIHQTHKLC